jgi:hypothetical protein
MMQSKYLLAGVALAAVGGALAVYLNVQGAACLTQLASIDRSAFPAAGIGQMERNCAIITNSYVYSLFAVAAGIIVLAVGRWKRR